MKTFEQAISLQEMRQWQLQQLNRQLSYARGSSAYYSRRLAGVSFPLTSPDQLSALPFLTAEELAAHGPELVCLPSSQIRRIVSLSTSGSLLPKRMYFSDADLERTVAFFSTGMRYISKPGQTVSVCMPGNTPNGISDLLCRGLRRMECTPLHLGSISDFPAAAEFLRQNPVDTIVGIPAQIRRLALLAPELRPKTVLLSSDYLPRSTAALLRRLWGCDVFDHFGMTETGYGCAVECPCHQGAHIRHDAFYVEIIDPESGAVLPPGTWGEIVLTTLQAEAMPLLRYRTGDRGRLLAEPCGCGSVLPRLDHVAGRIALQKDTPTLYQLEELLCGMDCLLDFSLQRLPEGLLISILPAEDGAEDMVRASLHRAFPSLQAELRPVAELVWTGKRTMK